MTASLSFSPAIFFVDRDLLAAVWHVVVGEIRLNRQTDTGLDSLLDLFTL